AADVEEGAQEAPGADRHAGQAVGAGAPQQLQQDRLGLGVEGMAGGQPAATQGGGGPPPGRAPGRPRPAPSGRGGGWASGAGGGGVSTRAGRRSALAWSATKAASAAEPGRRPWSTVSTASRQSRGPARTRRAGSRAREA